MKIECILIRDGGTHAEIGGVSYHFGPSPEHDGRHVAVVDNPLHAARFISIVEGYRMLPEALDDAGDGLPENAADPATESPAETSAEGDAGADAERAEVEAEQQQQAITQAAETIANAPDLSLMTREQLVAIHEARFGRKPHHRLAEDKLRDLLAQPPAAD